MDALTIIALIESPTLREQLKSLLIGNRLTDEPDLHKIRLQDQIKMLLKREALKVDHSVELEVQDQIQEDESDDGLVVL